MIRINNINIAVNHTEQQLYNKVGDKLRVKPHNLRQLKIVKRAVDARKKNNIVFVYTVDVTLDNERKYIDNKNVFAVKKSEYKIDKVSSEVRPIIVGAGPCGLFCGLVLAQSGLKPIIVEQGKDVDSRKADVDAFMNGGELNVLSNIQFGEGGAGTFSDGKLTTGIKNDRIEKVLQELVNAGADKSILYNSKPHLGTDVLIDVTRNIRKKIISLGGEVLFETKLVDFCVTDNAIESVTLENSDGVYVQETNEVVLAIGHSARDTFELLKCKNVTMQRKPFAVGVRIEHLQQFINEKQYGNAVNDKAVMDILGPADYKINVHLDNGVGVYTFCMCPGGVVVPSSSEKDSVVTNGMSYSKRDAVNANSAVLVSVKESDYNKYDENDTVLSGVAFQRYLEKLAFEHGGGDYKAPVQKVTDYINGIKSTEFGEVLPSYSRGTTMVDFNQILPEFLNESLKEGLIQLDKKINGFTENDAIITGIETRSSSPVTILRDDVYDSNIKGLMPVGEGAGYAGGITSSAVDGIRCAEHIVNKYKIKS